jgi:hypothetical protein
MPGVPRELIQHKLYLNLEAKPVKQRLPCFAQDKKIIIKREIARLLDADFIKEVYHPDWLANLVLVPKKNKIGGCVLIILISTRHVKKSVRRAPNGSSRGLHDWLQPSEFS